MSTVSFLKINMMVLKKLTVFDVCLSFEKHRRGDFTPSDRELLRHFACVEFFSGLFFPEDAVGDERASGDLMVAILYPLCKKFKFIRDSQLYPTYDRREEPTEWGRDSAKIKTNIIRLLDKMAA